MKKTLKILFGLVLLLLILGTFGFGWASWRSASLLARPVPTHTVEFPIPFPLDPAEVDSLGLTVEEAQVVALERAVERGQHLVSARYVCTECHGASLGGGVMVDDPMIGTLLGPNITTGTGSRTLSYTASDWDRIVRHSVRKGGTPSAMPSEDFAQMTDQELSDVIAFVRSRPPVDAEVPHIQLGPLGKVLIATGMLPLSVELVGDHQSTHAVMPPTAAVDVEFGRHLAGVCAGCHKADMSGGKITAGDPSWPPARNLTPHPEALGAWTLADFRTALTEARRPDGTALQSPMTMIPTYARNMTDVEMEALWTYLRSLPPIAPEGGA